MEGFREISQCRMSGHKQGEEGFCIEGHHGGGSQNIWGEEVALTAGWPGPTKPRLGREGILCGEQDGRAHRWSERIFFSQGGSASIGLWEIDYIQED